MIEPYYQKEFIIDPHDIKKSECMMGPRCVVNSKRDGGSECAARYGNICVGCEVLVEIQKKEKAKRDMLVAIEV